LRKIRFRRLFAVLVVVIILIGAVLVALFWSGKGEDEAIVSPLPQQPILEGPVFELPSLPLTPQTMTDAQREAAIEAAGEDALGAALSVGQSEEMAKIAAERARQAARSVFYPP